MKVKCDEYVNKQWVSKWCLFYVQEVPWSIYLYKFTLANIAHVKERKEATAKECIRTPSVSEFLFNIFKRKGERTNKITHGLR